MVRSKATLNERDGGFRQSGVGTRESGWKQTYSLCQSTRTAVYEGAWTFIT
jgi:hypothetical protein